VIGGLAVLIVGALIAVVVFRGGSGDTKLAVAKRACSLIAPADAQAVLGPLRGAPEPSPDTESCVFAYGTGGPGPIVSVRIYKEDATGSDFARFRTDWVRADYASSTRDDTLTDVPGLGGGAFLSTSPRIRSVVVLDPRRAIVFGAFGREVTSEQLVALARYAVARS
jgi:hypothetical protein